MLGSSETWKTSTPNHHNTTGSLNRSGTWQRGVGDDEHGLIARYTAKLAQSNGQAGEGNEPTGEAGSSSTGSNGAYQLLAQLEMKNQEILREIARIRREQEMGEGVPTGNGPFPLVEELSLLRQRKSELEQQLAGLQDSRKQLMVQLESLMKMIKVSSTFLPSFSSLSTHFLPSRF